MSDTNIFSNLTSDGLEQTGDVLGGVSVFDTDIYEATIKLAYAGKAASSNAQSITFHFDLPGGKEYRETIWVTTKDGVNYYPDKKDPNKKQQLPGFVTADHLCLLSTGFPLANQTMEEKVVSLYDFDAKKDLPKSVMVITSILGNKVWLAIQRSTVDKTKKVEGSNPPEYLPTGETRDENNIEKVFHYDSRKTVAELREGTESVFFDAWTKKNKGVTKNKAKGAEGKTGAPGRPPMPGAAANGTAKPATSLFNRG